MRLVAVCGAFTGARPSHKSAGGWCSFDRHACPCGYFGDPERDCVCAPFAVSRYQRRISGPLLDRIDLFVDVPRVAFEKLMANATGEPSSAVAARVREARDIQHARFAPAGHASQLNAEMSPNQVREFAQDILEPGAGDLLQMAVKQLNLSARAFHRLLKLSRTIADLAGSEPVLIAHVAESIQYRERVE